MSFLNRHHWLIFFATLISACAQTHYVATTGNRSQTQSNTSTSNNTAVAASYLLASINDGQQVVSAASGTWLNFSFNVQADPLEELEPNGVWRPMQPGYYMVSVSVAFPPPNSTGAGANFVPGAWPANSRCIVSVARNDGVTMRSKEQAVTGAAMCQAETTFVIPMRPGDALAFNAVVSTAMKTVTRAQLNMTSGFNPYVTLAISKLSN